MDVRKRSSKAVTHGGMTQFWTVFSRVSEKRFLQLLTYMQISPHGELLSLLLQQFQPTSAHPGCRPDLVLIEDLFINLLELTIPTNTYEALQAARNRISLYLQLVSDLEGMWPFSLLPNIENRITRPLHTICCERSDQLPSVCPNNMLEHCTTVSRKRGQ